LAARADDGFDDVPAFAVGVVRFVDQLAAVGAELGVVGFECLRELSVAVRPLRAGLVGEAEEYGGTY